LFDKAIFDEYFCSTAELTESSATVNRPEVDHLIHISSVNTKEWDPICRPHKRAFKELDAYWLFFYALANHCGSLLSTNGTATMTVNR
jgi:hypothetical protein